MENTNNVEGKLSTTQIVVGILGTILLAVAVLGLATPATSAELDKEVRVDKINLVEAPQRLCKSKILQLENRIGSGDYISDDVGLLNKLIGPAECIAWAIEILLDYNPQQDEQEKQDARISSTVSDAIPGPQREQREDQEASEGIQRVEDNDDTVIKGFDLDKWARAVAQKETGSCTAGVGRYNNCHGIRPGNTMPCTAGVSASNFCIYNTQEESYEAFKVIWSKWYTTDRFPTDAEAHRYSQSYEWKGVVISIYNQL